MENKKTNLKINSPFCPIPDEKLGPQLPPRKFEDTVIETVLVPYSVQVGDDPENVVIRYKPVVKAEYSLQDYIESFADDVGIQNILRKISISGDKSLLNQTGREPLCPDGGLEPIQDYSAAPRTKAEAFNAVAAGVAAFDTLPDDLKGKLSFEQFVKMFGQDEFNNYIKSLVKPAESEDNK